MRGADRHTFEKAIKNFPERVHPLLRQLPDQTGRLWPGDVSEICAVMALTPEKLALALLPIAQCFAQPGISRFRVGSVAVAQVEGDVSTGCMGTEDIALFLGSNLEFHDLPLYHTIHAEQAAVLNAWHAGAQCLFALAVSAPPCGLCRQFLMEAVGKNGLNILLPQSDDGYRRLALSALLPEAFGPGDLDRQAGLFEHASIGSNSAGGQAPFAKLSDPWTQAALMGATRSYAPYTDNLTGCVLNLAHDHMVVGRSVESAAYNPGLTALQSALALASLTGARLPDDIEKVVLAERPTTAGQAAAAEFMLSTWAPKAQITTHFF